MTNKTISDIFLEIRSRNGDQFASDELQKNFDLVVINQLSMIYQTQLNRNDNPSSLFKLKTNEFKNKSFKSFNKIVNDAIIDLKNNFELYSHVLNSKIEINMANLSIEEITCIRKMLDYNLIHNVYEISHLYFQEISKHHRLYVIEIIIINHLFNKLKKERLQKNLFPFIQY